MTPNLKLIIKTVDTVDVDIGSSGSETNLRPTHMHAKTCSMDSMLHEGRVTVGFKEYC